MSDNSDIDYKRNTPPSFPSGFKALQTDDVIIIDFLTAFPNELMQIFSSVALTRDVADNLVKALTAFLEDDDDDDDDDDENHKR